MGVETREWSAVEWCGQAKGKEMLDVDQGIGEGLHIAARHAKARTKVCDKQAKLALPDVGALG